MTRARPGRAAGIRLSAQQRLDWLRLSRAEGVGPRTFQGLINRFGGAASALENLPALAKSRGRSIRIPAIGEAEAEMRQAERLGIRLTLCPIDTRCIDRPLLRADERAWLNAYHATVRERLAPRLAGEALAWLQERTRPCDRRVTARAARRSSRCAAFRRGRCAFRPKPL